MPIIYVYLNKIRYITNKCPSGWTLEYGGYIVSALKDQQRGHYTCLDKAPEAVNGGSNYANSNAVYPVVTSCSAGFSCPPMVGNMDLRALYVPNEKLMTKSVD